MSEKLRKILVVAAAQIFQARRVTGWLSTR